MKIVEISKIGFLDSIIYYVTTEVNQFRYSELKWEVLIEDCYVDFDDDRLKKILTNEVNLWQQIDLSVNKKQEIINLLDNIFNL